MSEGAGAARGGASGGADAAGRPLASRLVELGYGRAHHLEREGTGGAPVLLLHPNGMNARIWEPVALLLDVPGTILAPDRRGHGLSAAPADGWTLDHHLADTLELLDRLATGPVHAVGAMTGANLALLLASRHPERVHSVTAIDPALALDPDVLRVVEESLAPEKLVFPSLDAALERTADPEWDAGTRALWARHFFRPVQPGAGAAPSGQGPVEWAFHAPGVLATERALVRSMWEEVAVACPALIVRGADSWVFSPEEQQRLVELIPGARAAEIASRLHPPYDDPAGIAALVAAHVAAAEAGLRDGAA